TPKPTGENSQAEMPTSGTKDNAADTETSLLPEKEKELVRHTGPGPSLMRPGNAQFEASESHCH
ncbi:Hypothetical predicted protein, partial [Marmota monax]